MKKAFCVKNKAELENIPITEIAMCPFKYEESQRCQRCGKTDGLLIRTTESGDYGLGLTLQELRFGSYHVYGSSTTTFNLQICGCSSHLKITREMLESFLNARGSGIELVDFENLGL